MLFLVSVQMLNEGMGDIRCHLSKASALVARSEGMIATVNFIVVIADWTWKSMVE